MAQVADEPATALEDASLSTWIGPTDGTQYQYYPKGSLAGFMLDVLIRDASDNRRSLDDVMRELYGTTYKKGRGFTAADWWPAVSRAAGRPLLHRVQHEVHRRPRAVPLEPTSCPAPGCAMAADTVREPRVGLATAQDSPGRSWCRRSVPAAWRRRPA